MYSQRRRMYGVRRTLCFQRESSVGEASQYLFRSQQLMLQYGTPYVNQNLSCVKCFEILVICDCAANMITFPSGSQVGIEACYLSDASRILRWLAVCLAYGPAANTLRHQQGRDIGGLPLAFVSYPHVNLPM